MRYSPKLYAKAFIAALEEKTPEKELIHNFLELIRQNGDWPKIKKIFAETEKLLREKTGRRKITIETARPLKNLEQSFKKLIEPRDIVEKKIDPELVAGMRITVNDENQFDGSLIAKLQKVFNP